MTAAVLTLGSVIAYANRAQAEQEPWLYGDEAWIADQPFEVLSRDEQVKRLETWL